MSGSFESTQDTLHQNAGPRSLPSEEGDEGSQLELSDASEDEEDLGDAKATRPAYKRGRKVRVPLPRFCFLHSSFS